MSQSAMGYEAKRQWPLWALAGVSLIWFLITLAASADLPIGTPQDLDMLAERATRLIPPLIVLLLMVAFIPGRKSMDLNEVEERLDAATRATGDLEAQLLRLDTALLACTDKVEVLRAAAASHSDGLGASAQALEVAAGTMALSANDLGAATGVLKDIVPAVSAQAKEAAAALGIAGSEARRHIETVETALAQVAAHGRDAGREAEAMVATMQGLIAQIDQSSTETTKTIANRAYTLDAAVTGVLDRSAEAFASIGETLSAQARSVEQMVSSAQAELDGFGLEGTRAIGQRLDVLLSAASQLRGQFGEQQALSEQLRETASGAIATIEARLEALRGNQAAASESLLAQADASARSFEARLLDMSERQREAQTRQQERLAESLEALESQMAQLREQQAEAAARMQTALAGAIHDIEGRLEGLKARQSALGMEMEEDAGRMVAGVESRLQELRLQQQQLTTAMAAETGLSLDAVANRFAELGQVTQERHAETVELLGRTMTAVATLGDALDQRHVATEALEARIDGLLPAFQAFADGSEARIPELARGLDTVGDRSREVAGQLDALADRIESQTALLRDSAAAFERDHAAVADLSRTLAGEFEAARGIVAEIHGTTEQTAIAAATRMVENVMQVRASVNATAAEIQTLLSSVVTEAEQALDEFASTKAEAAFGAPIRLQIAALEDASVKAAEAAGGASERLTARLVELMQVISETEARVDEVDTRMDVRARDTLAARSIRLVESLNGASVDVARLLAVDVGDSAWARYLQGDKSLFARATVRLADKETARKIARHFAHDPEFEGEAASYLDQFEMLIRRVLKDPDGESFALVLLSSDIGKLYVMIAEAIGRPVARRPE
jgi:hypothetical protein